LIERGQARNARGRGRIAVPGSESSGKRENESGIWREEFKTRIFKKRTRNPVPALEERGLPPRRKTEGEGPRGKRIVFNASISKQSRGF